MGYYDAQIRFKGQFDYHGLYNLMKTFWVSRGYRWYETKYKDKGKECEVKWTCEREYDEYHQVVFKIKIHLWDYDKVEVVEHGHRKTVVKARMIIDVHGGYDKLDWTKPGRGDAIFGKSKFQQWMKNLLDTQVRYREYEEHWDDVHLGTQWQFMSEVKSYLGMQDT